MFKVRYISRTLCRGWYCIFLASSMAGCTFLSAPAQANPPISANAPVYAYFIINGIARGAMMRDKIKPSFIKKLLSEDEKVRQVILHGLKDNTMKSNYQSILCLNRYLNSIPR